MMFLHQVRVGGTIGGQPIGVSRDLGFSAGVYASAPGKGLKCYSLWELHTPRDDISA